MADPLIPIDWSQELMESFVENMRRGQRMDLELMGLDPDNLDTTSEERPLDSKYLARRQEFKEKWETLTALGFELGYLTTESCYECGGEVKVDDAITRWVSVSNPDYDPDKPLPQLAQHVADGKPVTFTYATKRIPPVAGTSDE